MSSVVVVTTKQAAYMVTDGAVVDTASERLVGLVSKVLIMPQIPAAISVRGDVRMLPFLYAVMGDWNFPDIDALRAGLGSRLRKSIESYLGRRAMADFASPEMEVIAIGWSETRRSPEAFVIVTFEMDGYGQSPWEPFELGNQFAFPCDDEILQNTMMPWRSKLTDQNIAAYGMAVLEAQRAKRFPLGVSGRPGNWSGGFAQLTTVAPFHTVTTRLLGRWPDKVGESIQPRQQRLAPCLT